MPDFVIRLERRVSQRETTSFTVEAADLGEAEHLARQRVRSEAAAGLRWRAAHVEPGPAVVVDVEEAPLSPGRAA